jgi:hypothetical protein
MVVVAGIVGVMCVVRDDSMTDWFNLITVDFLFFAELLQG